MLVRVGRRRLGRMRRLLLGRAGRVCGGTRGGRVLRLGLLACRVRNWLRFLMTLCWVSVVRGRVYVEGKVGYLPVEDVDCIKR